MPRCGYPALFVLPSPAPACDNRVLSGFNGFRGGLLAFPRRILRLVQKVENDADFLRPGFPVAGVFVHDNLLNELVHNHRRQFRDVRVLLRQGDEAVKIAARLLTAFQRLFQRVGLRFKGCSFGIRESPFRKELSAPGFPCSSQNHLVSAQKSS